MLEPVGQLLSRVLLELQVPHIRSLRQQVLARRRIDLEPIVASK